MAETAVQIPATKSTAAAATRSIEAERTSVAALIKDVLTPLASLRLTVALFALSLVLVLCGTLAQRFEGINTVLEKYFRAWGIVWFPLQIFFPVSMSVPIKFPYPGGWLLGSLLLTNLIAAHAVRFTVSWRRAGILIIHSGLVVMFLSEFVTGMWAIEGNMTIVEGGASNFIEHTHATELAIIDRLDPETDDVAVVPGRMLREGALIQHELLPFDVEVVRFMVNSALVDPKEAGSAANPATVGDGLSIVAVEQKEVSGTDPEQKVDIAAAYVTFRKKGSGESLGTYLVSLQLYDAGRPQLITLGNRTYEVFLRFKRTYKPYTIHLADFKHDVYLGTDKPKDYSSYVRLVDPTVNEDREVRIWMNHPLRHAGETFYQSSFLRGDAGTVLQVVKNPGWLMPYISCAMVAAGMLAHFGLHLYEFLRRQAVRPAPAVRPADGRAARSNGQKSRRNQPHDDESFVPTIQRLVPWAAAAFAIIYFVAQTRSPKPDSPIAFDEFGKLPVVYQGRLKPLDTLARNNLMIISNRQTFVATMDSHALKRNWAAISRELQKRWRVLKKDELRDFKGNVEDLVLLIQDRTGDDDAKVATYVYELTSEKQPAIRWLLDVMTHQMRKEDEPNPAELHKVFRIENDEVLSVLGLERRDGMRYAIAEFKDKMDVLQEQAELAQKVPEKDRTLYQHKVTELARHLMIFINLSGLEIPHAVPPREEGDEWRTLTEVDDAARQVALARLKAEKPGIDPSKLSRPELDELVRRVRSGAEQARAQISPAAASLGRMLSAYADQDAAGFNRELAEYRQGLPPAAAASLPRMNFEAFFNRFAPFYHGAVLYALGFTVACVGFLVSAFAPRWSVAVNRVAFWLIVPTFLVHTFALVARMYLMNRWFVLVTNLYSSAIYIGWVCVMLGLVLQLIFRNGIGNVLAGVTGFLSLLVAHGLALAADGDTLEMMQAVLDTNFWLATHVTCITKGYGATFLAGFIAIVFILMGFFSWLAGSELDRETSRVFGLMIYGVVCFATLLSFTGTVLGGIWADQSWGRFWGWDPKENGALMIVIWNALILHARWGGMVRERGMAMLAIAGNIVTAWSWFGTNQLGVGLHAYGFSNSLAFWLLSFWTSQLMLLGVGGIWLLMSRPKIVTRPAV
jgi:ABC-type transport system involved in cytochrome c biogenesis permease subunit